MCLNRLKKPLLLLSICLSMTLLQANVEHKEEYIDVYLSNISKSMDEKTELLEHIKRNPDGRFIDIGTGGDSIVIMAEQLPKNARPTLIAADIDPLVLASIRKRRPEVERFIDSKTGPSIELLTMSATDMSCITDNSLSGISASALAHEVHSYTPIKGGLDQFLWEVCRTLEKNGVFIYRDPKWVDDPETQSILTIRSEIGKYYASLFLIKFLDRKFSLIRDYKNACCKPEIYSSADVKMTIYLKNAQKSLQITFEEFLKMPSTAIDYARSFSIEAPKGLLAELQRHYLMYLKNYYPVGLFDFNQFQNALDLSILSQEHRELIDAYALKQHASVTDNRIEADQFPRLFKELDTLRKIFSQAYTISTSNNPEVLTFANVLLKDGIDRNLLHITDDQTLAIDPKVLTLLFRGKDQNIFRYLGMAGLPLDLLEHLKMEGEEHYFYKTTDELITYVGQYSRYILKDSPKNRYCLAPIDAEYVKEASRELYQAVLEKDMPVIDQHGIVQAPVTEKNIIHFQLQPERKAFSTYKNLIAKSPDKFPKLKKWVNMGDHEVLDLVSDADEVIGAMTKNDIYTKDVRNFRVVNAFVVNSKGELWVPIRHSSKRLFPLSLDCSVGGPVLTNETYYDAFVRQTSEDLNLDVMSLPHKKLGKLIPHVHHTWGFIEVYVISYDGPINYNPDDFTGGEWLSPEQLKKMLQSGHAAKDDLKIIAETFF